MSELPVFADTIGWEEAQTELAALELDDGLPLVPPTRSRLDAMLAMVREPMRSYGQVVPMYGELTPAAVAYQAVLAGCLPTELATVLTAIEACLEPQFNLLGILTTTGTPAVAVIVHGRLARALGVSCGTNCLGPGNRANACIGRAVSLSLRNIGGAREGVGDMATMGQPGKYGFCFAEGAAPAFPSLPQRRGLERDAAAVTVLGVSGTQEILPASPGDTPHSVLYPVAQAMHTALEAGGAARKPERGEQFFLLPPELATLLTAHQQDLARVREHLFTTRAAAGLEGTQGADLPPAMRRGLPIARGPEDIHPIVTGGPGIKMTYLPLWGGGSLSVTRPVRAL